MCLSKLVLVRAEKLLWQKYLVLVVLITDASLVYFESPAWACLSWPVRRQPGTQEQVSQELFGGLVFTLNGCLLPTLIMELHQRWEFMGLLLFMFICWQLSECVRLQPQGRSRLAGDSPQPSAASAEPNRRHNRALVPQAFPCPTHKILAVNSLFAIHYNCLVRLIDDPP